MANQKLQSAMEYLMTYGWSILIILVVLGILYALHVFSPGSILGGPNGSCIVTAKFICEVPILAQNGTISFTTGQDTGVTFYNIALACTAATNSSGGPYAANGVNPWRYVNQSGALFLDYNPSSAYVLNSGDKLSVNGQQCYGIAGQALSSAGKSGSIKVYSFEGPSGKTEFAASVPLGTSFSGILWMEYTTGAGAEGGGNSWIVSQVATFTASASQASSTAPSTTSVTTTTTVNYYSCGVCVANQTGYECPSSCPSTTCPKGEKCPLPCTGASTYCFSTSTTSTTSTSTIIYAPCGGSITCQTPGAVCPSQCQYQNNYICQSKTGCAACANGGQQFNCTVSSSSTTSVPVARAAPA